MGGAIAALLALLAFTPLGRWVLVDLMNEAPDGDVLRLALPALMVGAALPLFNGLRYVLRGILISRGSTRPITVANATTLVILAALVELRWFPSQQNGTLNAYSLWLGMIVLETAILAWIAFRLVGRQVRESGPDGPDRVTERVGPHEACRHARARVREPHRSRGAPVSSSE